MTRAEDFAEALNRLERDRDLDAFLGQFADGAVLVRPESGSQETGVDGARRFWQTYLDQFEQVRSTFGRIVDAGAVSELEWVGDGRLASGRPVRYAGVSLLEHDSAGKVTRFATYYDTAAFTTPSAAKAD
jgi:ketosteroid isomerase-like protein